MSTTLPTSLALAGLSLLCACSPYRAGSFHGATGSFPEERATQGCVDVAIRASLDPMADGPVVDLHLGNRCSDSVWVDIPALGMTVTLPEGHPLPVEIYDPRSELKTTLLGGLEQTMVRLELVAPDSSVRVCARLDRLASEDRPGPPKVLCTPVEVGV